MARTSSFSRWMQTFLASAVLVGTMQALANQALQQPSQTQAPAPSPTPQELPEPERHVVVLKNKDRVYSEVTQVKSAKAVFVLLNGLVYDMNRWDLVADALVREGHTVVRYAYSGQPENLRLLQNGEQPKFFATGLDPAQMAAELDEVLNQLGIHQKVHLVGLSYGASVAAAYATRHPEKVEATIFASPLVIPLDYYDSQGRGLRAWLGAVRFWENAPCDFYGAVNPWLCMSTDYWYDSFYRYFYENYLVTRVKNIPDGVNEATYKKAVFHLVRAARDFDLRTTAPQLSNVHMMIASEDEKALQADQIHAWNEVEAKEQRSFWVFEGAYHALPDETPLRMAEALNQIAHKAPETQMGRKISVPANQ